MGKELITRLRPYLGIIIVCLLTVMTLLPLFESGFFTMHDDEQVGRTYELHYALENGHIPPRISQNLGFGYGYPLFNYYPSFVYYVAEVFVLLGFSYIVSVKLMIALGFFFAAITMYLFAREYFGELGGIVASVAYTYAPYHAVDVYVRGALPEFWSFVFIPLLFYSLKKLADTGHDRYIVILALGIASLILTHNLVAFMSVIFIGLYGLYLLTTVEHKLSFVTKAVLGGVIGLFLSAYFWLPSYFEKNFTMIELLTKELADYHHHFVYLRQLWNSPWGFGGSLYGLEDGLSFEIGKLHLVGSGIALLLAGYFTVRKKRVPLIIYFFGFLLLLAIFLTSFYSEVVWDAIQPLSYIQFPWRFLLFTVFSASLLLGSIFYFPFPKKIRFALAGVLTIGIIMLNVSYFQPARYLPDVDDDYYVSNEALRWRTSVMAFEYVPKGIATKQSAVGTTVIDITPSGIASSTARVVSGSVSLTTLSDKPQEKKLRVTTRDGGEVQLQTFSFPGWKVLLDGKEVSYSDDNPLKLITIFVPAGTHQIDAVFTDTLLRKTANVLSLTGVGLLILVALWGKVLRTKK